MHLESAPCKANELRVLTEAVCVGVTLRSHRTTTDDGAHSRRAGRSPNALWVNPICCLRQKVEKCSTFQAAMEPSANQMASHIRQTHPPSPVGGRVQPDRGLRGHTEGGERRRREEAYSVTLRGHTEGGERRGWGSAGGSSSQPEKRLLVAFPS